MKQGIVFATSRRRRFASTLSVVAVTACLIDAARPTHAQTIYLVGAELYSATSNGANSGTAYLYNTNPNTVDHTLQLVLNGNTYNKSIAIPLALGANNFTINLSPQGAVDPGNYAGIGLFFSTTATPYDPSGAGSARTPDLVFASAVGPGPLVNFTPAAGLQIEDYDHGGPTNTTNVTIAANGLPAFPVGGEGVTVSNLSVTHNATGAFTINASAPEPGSCAFLVATGLSAIVIRRRWNV